MTYSRNFIDMKGRYISYLDFKGTGSPLIALHGHFGRATMFSGLAETLGLEWRVLAIDQQGHGWSDRSEDYSRDSYILDTVRFIDHLGISPVVLYGHSLGGVNAYQIAAQYPEW